MQDLPRTPPSPRLLALALALGVPLALVTAGPMAATAQRRPRAIPMQGTTVQWSLFVSGRDGDPSRTVVTSETGGVTIAGTPYECRYGAPSRNAMGGGNWSETRTLECQIGTTVVSTSGFCQVSGASWGARAAVLYLAEQGDTERVQVTLDCAVQPAAR